MYSVKNEKTGTGLLLERCSLGSLKASNRHKKLKEGREGLEEMENMKTKTGDKKRGRLPEEIETPNSLGGAVNERS